MATDKWDIVSRVQNRIKDLPSALGSEVLAEYVEDAAIHTEQFTGKSVNLSDIGSQFFPVLTNMAAATVAGYELGVGVSYSAGRLSIDKRTELDGNQRKVEFFVNMANGALNSLGKKIEHDTTEPTG